MNKKAISPLIATILLIAFTIVLATIILTWTTKLTKSNLEKAQAEGEFNCLTNVKIDILKACHTSNQIIVKIENQGTTELSGFITRVEGNPPKDPQNIRSKIQAFGFKEISVQYAGEPQKIYIMPTIDISDITIPCSKKAITSTVESC